MYKVSVIMPCYNVEKTLDRAMESLENQTIGFENIEVFLPCDLSTDETVKTAMAWKIKYPLNVKVLFPTERVMQGALRNKVLDQCDSEYIAFLDADDWFEKDALMRAYSMGKNFDADLVNFRFIQVNSTEYTRPPKAGLDIFKVFDNADDRAEFFTRVNLLRCCWDKIYKTDFVKRHKLRFSEGKFEEESLFTITAYMFAERVFIINDYLHCYYKNPHGSSSSMQYNLPHSRDNEKVWIETYELALNDGILKSDCKLFEWLFVINYYFYSTLLAEVRKVPYSEEDKAELARTVKKLFPNYLENEYLKRTHYDLNEIEKRL